mgnify:CR=1 FL=1
MKNKKEIKNIDQQDVLSIIDESDGSKLAIFNHLTPRKQELLSQAKSFQQLFLLLSEEQRIFTETKSGQQNNQNQEFTRTLIGKRVFGIISVLWCTESCWVTPYGKD